MPLDSGVAFHTEVTPLRAPVRYVAGLDVAQQSD
jgi:hypothetical protein